VQGDKELRIFLILLEVQVLLSLLVAGAQSIKIHNLPRHPLTVPQQVDQKKHGLALH